MKLSFLLLLLTFSYNSIVAQELPKWYRVYTFEESIVDMDTSEVILGGDIGRVRFRWNFDELKPLASNAQLKYKTKLETIEFKCSDNLYRFFQIKYLNSAGKELSSELMRPPYKWHTVEPGSVMQTIFDPACKLIERELRPITSETKSSEQADLTRAAKFAFSFSHSLQQAKDFKPIIKSFFAPDYLRGYLRDNHTNWFLNLDRDTAEKASQGELQRFYVALLNAAYLSSLYLVSQEPSDDDSIEEGKLLPADVMELVNSHPYTAHYKGKRDTYDYLAENIDSVERLRSYTDLLERMAALMRRHAVTVDAERSSQWQDISEDRDLYDPKIRTCARECLGLPEGTRLFEVKVPLFYLQIADLKGRLKVISVMEQSKNLFTHD